MGHNITLMELGWLCTALVSLLRNSPHLVHADQNSQKLLKLISDSKCNSTSTTEAAATSTMSSSITNILSDNGLLEKLGAASVTAEQSNQSPPFIDVGHQRLVDWLMTVVYTLISLFGIVGNIFVVIVVRTVPGMISPTNCYLMSLAVSDCIVLLSAAPVELSFLHVDWYAFGSIGCKVLSFLPFLGINSSSMSITAFTVERFIGICYPLRASPWLYLATLIEAGDDVQCGFRLERDDWAYKVMFVADFSAFYLIPMIMYIYIYTRITYTLTRSDIKYSIANDLIHRISQDANTALVSSVPDSPVSPTSNGTKNVPKRSQGRDSVIKMLALVVFIFAVSWLPYRAMVMYNSFAKNFNAEMWNPEWFIYLSKTMIFFNW
uniref:Thyrotropin-releasing hormone receptor n=1 Tax=Globodera pallida TaxID=36090 RepID=A0A183BKX2_GLOPA